MIHDSKIAELAKALHKANEPKPPTQHTPFDYPLTEAIARARAGSVADARMLIMLAAAMLKHRELAMPGNVVILNGELAAYLAETLEAAANGMDARKALHLARKRGRTAKTNEQRDAWLAYVADWLKWSGHRKRLETTADMLARVNYPPPKAGDTWTAKAVGAAIKAHEKRQNKSTDLMGKRSGENS